MAGVFRAKRPCSSPLTTVRKIMKQALHSPIVNRMPWSDAESCDPQHLITREWLVTNGLGGYASGTVSGIATRRYHGLLIAALPAPLGRMMLFNHLIEHLRFANGTTVLLAGDHMPTMEEAQAAARNLASFSLEFGLPVWRYQIGSAVLEKRLLMQQKFMIGPNSRNKKI
jgi:hypothetical protein